MTVFDAPDREFCIVRRAITNTPLQALTLLNDPHLHGSRAETGGASRFTKAARRPTRGSLSLFRLATGRAPDRGERTILQANARQDAGGVSGR